MTRPRKQTLKSQVKANASAKHITSTMKIDGLTLEY